VSGTDAVEEKRARDSPVKVVLRIALVVGALAISAFVLYRTFDDLDWDAIVDAVRGLTDADVIALAAVWVLWVAAQGLLTASLVEGLPVRRGVLAYLAPAAVTSLVPGPSDLPLRYRMLTSWGSGGSDATLALAASGLFSVGIKLVLPVIAAVGLLVSDAPIDRTLRPVVVAALIIGVVLGVCAFVLSSERRTQRAGRLLDPVWRAVVRLMRRDERADLGTRLVTVRTQALDRLRGRWLTATWATALTATLRYSLLLMAVRFTGVPDEAASWAQVFVVYAIVQGLTVLPITAGDVGVSEVALIGLLTAAAGTDYVNEVTAGVLIFRVLTWLLIIPAGLGALAVWRRTVAGKDDRADEGA
jgi:uncharacterized membrane protein YbhN (UPF0104 family)